MQQYLKQVELLRAQMAHIDEVLGLAMKPHAPTLHRLCRVPGIDLAAAQGLLAEIGPTAAALSSAEEFASWAAVRTRDTFFASLFARLKPRVEAKGAAWAVAHRIRKLLWLMLPEGVDYQAKGPAAQNPNMPARKFHRLMKDFQRLGIDPRSLIQEGLSAHA